MPLSAPPSPLVTLTYTILRLHIRSVGYQQLGRRCAASLTCEVQRRHVALSPTQGEGKEGQHGWHSMGTEKKYARACQVSKKVG